VRQALTEPAPPMPLYVNTALINAHVTSTALAAFERPVKINLPGALEYCKPHGIGVRMLTSWVPMVNTNMEPIPTAPVSDSIFEHYDRFSAYTRTNQSGHLIVAPTWVLSELLVSFLINGSFPENNQLGASGAVVDACIANCEPAANSNGDKRFKPPPLQVQNVSNALVLEALMPHAHGFVVLQGTAACKNFVRLFKDRSRKILAQELQTTLQLPEEEIDWIMKPTGNSSNQNWGLHIYKDDNSTHLVACIPSLTNLVPNNQQGVDRRARQRLAHALAAVVKAVRLVAGLQPTQPVETIATHFLNCLLPANAVRMQSLLRGPISLQNPLGPTYISPYVAGGLASVLTHGEQMRHGGQASVLTHGEQMRHGGQASVLTHGEQMRHGGQASVLTHGEHMRNG